MSLSAASDPTFSMGNLSEVLVDVDGDPHPEFSWTGITRLE